MHYKRLYGKLPRKMSSSDLTQYTKSAPITTSLTICRLTLTESQNIRRHPRIWSCRLPSGESTQNNPVKIQKVLKATLPTHPNRTKPFGRIQKRLNKSKNKRTCSPGPIPATPSITTSSTSTNPQHHRKMRISQYSFLTQEQRPRI